MSQLSPVLRAAEGNRLTFWCPGCDKAHSIRYGAGGWSWNGDAERPVFSPSVLVRSGHYAEHFKQGDSCWCSYNAEHPDDPPTFACRICHSYVGSGDGSTPGRIPVPRRLHARARRPDGRAACLVAPRRRDSMKPSIGRIVIVRNHGLGSVDAAAIVTRVWGQRDPADGEPSCVNVQVLPDCNAPTCKTSVPLYETREQAEQWLELMVGHTPTVAWWPEREPQQPARQALRKAA